MLELRRARCGHTEMLALWSYVVSAVPAVHPVFPMCILEGGAGRVHTLGREVKRRRERSQ